MRRTTTRSPSGRNFIGILFLKGLSLLDFEQIAALASDECQCRARYLGTPRGTVKAKEARKAKKPAPGRGTGDERLVSFKAFSGYFRKASNSLILLSLFMWGSAGPP